jgi:hypothetical protein
MGEQFAVRKFLPDGKARYVRSFASAQEASGAGAALPRWAGDWLKSKSPAAAAVRAADGPCSATRASATVPSRAKRGLAASWPVGAGNFFRCGTSISRRSCHNVMSYISKRHCRWSEP